MWVIHPHPRFKEKLVFFASFLKSRISLNRGFLKRPVHQAKRQGLFSDPFLAKVFRHSLNQGNSLNQGSLYRGWGCNAQFLSLPLLLTYVIRGCTEVRGWMQCLKPKRLWACSKCATANLIDGAVAIQYKQSLTSTVNGSSKTSRNFVEHDNP